MGERLEPENWERRGEEGGQSWLHARKRAGKGKGNEKEDDQHQLHPKKGWERGGR